MSFHSGGLVMSYHQPSYTSSLHQSTKTSPKDGEDSPTHDGQNRIGTSPRNDRTAKLGRTRKRFVFQDPVAFRYLEEDPATDAIERWRRLQGYEMYVVEQWACSRTHPTFVICTYSGDPSHSILVNVLSVPSDESTWSPRLQIYFQAVSQFHAKEMETPLGTLMVTNLSGFPSALTVIAVPDGDVKKHRNEFIINENLKRMGCSGRAAINLQPPQPSTIAKYHHLYRTSEAVPLYQSVMELVRTCQTALVIYDKLQQTYADGLLCDVTEKAVQDWWTDIGTYFYNVQPSDGLGPATVAAILGLLIGAYNRLRAFGSPVGKDALDLISMKRAIGHFQKGQKMERSRRLDRETLDRLHRATAKSAAGEGWTVPKAVKSTVAELSGKGGEMVMGIVGAREKAGISDAETMDIERLSRLVTGQKMKWLWQGKPVKSADMFSAPSDDLKGRIFSTDDQGNFLWTANHHDSISDGGTLERTDTMVTNQTQDGKSSRGRIRDAVGGLRTHTHRYPREGEEASDWIESTTTGGTKSAKDPPGHRDRQLRPAIGRTQTDPLAFAMALREAAATSPKKSDRQSNRSAEEHQKQIFSHREVLRPAHQAESPRKKKMNAEMADLRNEFKADIYRNFSAELPYMGPRSRALRRSQSAIQMQVHAADDPRKERMNRQLSFSLLENAVLDFGKPVMDDDYKQSPIEGDLTNALTQRETAMAAAQKKAKQIQAIQQGLVPYTENTVAHVESLDLLAHQHLEQLNEMYYSRLEEYQSLSATSSDLVSQEKAALTESFRRIEMLGAKLDYELGSVQSRLQEVEDGVDDFERNVIAIEAKVKELIGDEIGKSVPWYQRLLTSIGSRK
ncbi:uncharacterized protein A1O9_00224 [Exophiala aquamarina CBS 119918]|uniref:STB6-like N-terminal domain-containing protein n=1 Tax=Exophiala aquamarina CBS 119918 TaxID=1182545 RepID=A0A072PR92_9EURO|nr:uncharacterized protein A1O9_00224 [Exophiala aquamarina CBS 119918]KEF62252.1 hypothetical protein A1O9_00224 [Exophiala aquamarina CBS 119918]